MNAQQVAQHAASATVGRDEYLPERSRGARLDDEGRNPAGCRREEPTARRGAARRCLTPRLPGAERRWGRAGQGAEGTPRCMGVPPRGKARGRVSRTGKPADRSAAGREVLSSISLSARHRMQPKPGTSPGCRATVLVGRTAGTGVPWGAVFVPGSVISRLGEQRCIHAGASPDSGRGKRPQVHNARTVEACWQPVR